ncbi:hypothetical protein TL16_g09568 [Triparma laevis f. inornata]|uniref:Leucine-rich repeat domain-containing protein n=1 Tax=Triparma laevis f. inornata TaxID=1714386 RepID=A0A9W7B3L3_9STRA|nr:hypothetical protein TL16_g09568 [Triparma laevis f. inornata]
MSLNSFLSGNNFLNTGDFRMLLVQFVPGDALMTQRLMTKAWKRVADSFVYEGVQSGAVMVQGGKDISLNVAEALKERRKLLTRVIFLLTVTKVGNCACLNASNLVVVDLPEGVESIGVEAFGYCSSLTTVSFPTTLKKIGACAFWHYRSLENVDLRYTNLREIGTQAFTICLE